MRSGDLERVVSTAHSGTPVMDAEHLADSFPPIELQIAVASAVSNGEPLAVVAAIADLPSLAVLDALDALHPIET